MLLPYSNFLKHPDVGHVIIRHKGNDATKITGDPHDVSNKLTVVELGCPVPHLFPPVTPLAIKESGMR